MNMPKKLRIEYTELIWHNFSMLDYLNTIRHITKAPILRYRSGPSVYLQTKLALPQSKTTRSLSAPRYSQLLDHNYLGSTIFHDPLYFEVA